ncbi:MAG: nucleotidyltransferase domain-containing protein [archaeon]
MIDSQAKARLLEKMLERPGASFSVSGFGRLADLSKASVSNIVSEWEKAGLVLSKHEGRNKMVYMNTKYYLLPEMKKVFEKTRDFQKPFVEKLKRMSSLKKKSVKAIIVFGSRARKDFNHFSDLDVLVALEEDNGNISEMVREEFVKATGRTGIRFSPIIMAKKELKERWKEKDNFLKNILEEGKVLKGGKWIGSIQATP